MSATPCSLDDAAYPISAMPTRSRARARESTTRRRSNPKSKTGCRTCKKRKVKCDEHKPSCHNCVKHAVTCDYIKSRRFEPPGQPGQVPASVADARFPSGFLPFNDVKGHGSNALANFDVVDLELMHNFGTLTYTTLSTDPAVRQMLKTTAVRLALNCDFLLRSILAVSALHIAHFRCAQKDFYTSRALEHHQIANRAAVSRMGDLKAEDCENLHLFAVMTLFFALGSPRDKQASNIILDDSIIPNWLIMHRSTEPILQLLDPPNYSGPLGPIFDFGRERWHVLNGSRCARGSCPSLLSDIQSRVNKYCNDEQLLPIYNGVIDDLRNMLSMLGVADDTSMNDADTSSSPTSTASSCPKLEASDIFVWQWHVAKDFLPLMRSPEPKQEAVAIFAHFLVILKKVETQWWLEGWATHIMEKVWTVLDEEHRLWIQWSVEELGWVPPW